MRRPRIRRRPDRRTPALAVSVLILLAGAAGLWWGLAAVIDGQPLAGLDAVDGGTWGHALVAAAAVISVLLGLILIMCALVPGRAAAATVDGDHGGPGRTTVITTRGLALIAEEAAMRTEGTVSARAKGSPGAVRVRAGTVAPNARDARRILSDRIGERLSALGLRRQPRIRVTVRQKERR